MRNTNAVTETMNIQLRQTKFRYWRRSNVRSGGSVSTLLGILKSDVHRLRSVIAGNATQFRRALDR